MMGPYGYQPPPGAAWRTAMDRRKRRDERKQKLHRLIFWWRQ
jgi:hypothetical protein